MYGFTQTLCTLLTVFFSFRSVASDKRLVAGQTMPFLVRLLSDSHNALRHQSCTILYHLFENRANFVFFFAFPFSFGSLGCRVDPLIVY